MPVVQERPKVGPKVQIVNAHQVGIQLRSETGEVLTLGSLENAAQLRDALVNYLSKRGHDIEYITTYHARRRAKAEGYDLSPGTLNSACARLQIPNAKKLHGRWKMPLAEFEVWYNDWKIKKDKEPEHG